ncbi:hypothetical protein ACFW94_29085 [Streptomyces sp. NPDC059460]
MARDANLTLTVADNDVGMKDNSSRSGLRNIAERAEKLGGTLCLESGPSGGTRRSGGGRCDRVGSRRTPDGEQAVSDACPPAREPGGDGGRWYAPFDTQLRQQP